MVSLVLGLVRKVNTRVAATSCSYKMVTTCYKSSTSFGSILSITMALND